MRFRGTSRPPGLSRRTILVGGGIGAGLLLAWSVWPRRYEPNLRAAPGESLFNAFLKIGNDGRVIVAVPQVELGQGVYTSLPQILADELGADWRTVSVEPAPIGPLYANNLLAEESAAGALPGGLESIGRWAAREFATRHSLMLTGGSTSVRAFEAPLRDAGAAARALLCRAAARRWDVDWDTLDTAAGFVVHGNDRIAFAELAEEAAREEVPDEVPIRGGHENRLVGEDVPRIDLPSKVDGSAQFAGDIRLPDMVYASIRQGPVGAARLTRIDKAEANRIPGVLAIFENPGWIAAVARTWWAANKAVEALKPSFRIEGAVADSVHMEQALEDALASGDVTPIARRGDLAATYAGGSNLYRGRYSAGPAPSAPPETLTATARATGDRLEIWAASQAPALARAAAARAAGVGEGQVTFYTTLGGGGYGRKLEMAAIEQAAILATRMDRPVQVVWSRMEETMQDGVRPPAKALLTARLEGGRLLGWGAKIAAPSAASQVARRLDSDRWPSDAEASAVAGAVPPYDIPALAIEQVALPTDLRLGMWRSSAHSYTAFFTESFVDELARIAGIEPLSFRMAMLGGNQRLARALTTAATIGGWDGGGSGSSMGIACHSAFGSHMAVLVEVAAARDQRIRVRRAVAAVDVGRAINPNIVRQQIEGGIIHGIGGATGSAATYEGGVANLRGYGDLALPILADSPEVTVEILPSLEPPGGVTELGVPPVAPAIANAVFALTGQRLRSLPLVLGGA